MEYELIQILRKMSCPKYCFQNNQKNSIRTRAVEAHFLFNWYFDLRIIFWKHNICFPYEVIGVLVDRSQFSNSHSTCWKLTLEYGMIRLHVRVFNSELLDILLPSKLFEANSSTEIIRTLTGILGGDPPGWIVHVTMTTVTTHVSFSVNHGK